MTDVERIKLLEDEVKKLQWKNEGFEKRIDELESRLRNMEHGLTTDPLGYRGQ